MTPVPCLVPFKADVDPKDLSVAMQEVKDSFLSSMTPVSRLVPAKAVPDVDPKLDLAVAMQEYIRGQMHAGCINHCPAHLGIPHKITKDGWVRNKRFARFRCCSAKGNHSGSVCALWYQINGTVPKELVPELEKCYRYPPPAGAVVTCRPCPEKCIISEDVPDIPLSPRGRSYYDEGLLNSRKGGENVFISEKKENEAPLEESNWISSLGMKRAITRMPSTTSPLRISSLNHFGNLRDEGAKNQIENKLVGNKSKTIQPVWNKVAIQKPPRNITPNIPLAKRRTKILEMTAEIKKMIYDGRDPLKAKLTEMYVYNMHRTTRGNLRKALRSDGIDTSKIIDIQFIGKSITLLLIPDAFKSELISKLNALKRFQILDVFDPLNVCFMKTLPQYEGKSEEELLRIAMEQAKDRIARHIGSLPTSRVGTINYYRIMQAKQENKIYLSRIAENKDIHDLIYNMDERIHIKVGTFNVGGMKRKLGEAIQRIVDLDLDWVWITETKWMERTPDPVCSLSNIRGPQGNLEVRTMDL